ncbi:GNAT family N-acetyltransferase [Caulobacter sp. KR2-114]|uniref:GNAT family N-acetyltransferase n=1 Tax=Caulobacter sp. KR2-114 TaxID=3400912 RepID=UPI003C0B7964
MSPTLRPAGAGLAVAMAATHALAFDAPWRAGEIADLLAAPGAFALAIGDGDDAGDDLAGFILCRAIAGEAEVLTLAVAPAMRRQGLARALLEAAILTAAAGGAEAMFLEVAEDNAAAIGLYAGAGFARVGLRRGYYDGPAGRRDALVLRRDLNR